MYLINEKIKEVERKYKDHAYQPMYFEFNPKQKEMVESTVRKFNKKDYYLSITSENIYLKLIAKMNEHKKKSLIFQ